ncbi:MAG: CDP-alcohol phosphatidyltransferase family protein [Candidatus Diapherotrites archaeon]|nr:CDP-alcohol phosphatidyltransferase family protein [Candidatus Diapherotrites archaeon]
MLSQLRKKTKPLTYLLAKPFAVLNLHPNFVSFLAIPLIIIAAYFIYSKNYLIAAAFVLLATLMDFIDGAVAELTKKKSYFGNYFETMIDKYVDVILIASFSFHYPVLSAIAVGLSMISSYAKPRAALVIIADNRDWPAIGEHADKLIIIIFFMILASFMPKVVGIDVIAVMLWVLIVVSLIGGMQRIMYAKKLIAEAEKKGKILPYLRKGAGHNAVE